MTTKAANPLWQAQDKVGNQLRILDDGRLQVKGHSDRVTWKDFELDLEQIADLWFNLGRVHQVLVQGAQTKPGG